jgi:protocatechuate 3,4-dioxygenase beta subunit
MPPNHHADNDELHDHDLGLSHDLPTLLIRRRALGLLTGAGLAAALAACSSDGTSPATTSSSGSAASPTTAATRAAAAGTEIPEETAGPYPGDGSNGVNVLTESGIVRSDITSSFGTASGVAKGVPLTITLRVLDTANGSAPPEGAAVYLWHCDQSGRYSLYSDGVTNENYLRGVQAAAADGTVTFTSVYPAAYSGRWPHIHFEVYPSLADATRASGKLRTSQVALPEKPSKLVYATDGYDASLGNLAQTSLQTDMVFSDGWSLQLGKVTGDVDTGMAVTLNVPV